MIRTITFDDALWQVVPKDRSYETRSKQIIAFNTESGDLDDKLEAAHQELLAAAPQPQEHSSPCGNDEEHSFWVDSQDWPCPICAAKKQPQEQSEPVAWTNDCELEYIQESQSRSDGSLRSGAMWNCYDKDSDIPLYTAPPSIPAKVKDQSEPVAWMIKFKSPENPDWLNVHYHGTNAIADYRQIDPDATVTALFEATPDLAAKVAELEAEKNETIRISKKHIARCDVRAAEQEARITELESTIAAQADQIRGAREAIELAHQQLQRVAEFNWPDARRTKLNHSIFVCEEALAKIGGA